MLRRFAEYHDLQGAFGRRALIERAKGILMERHAIDEASAFEMLREQSRTDNRKLVDLAAAVVDGHRLLPRDPQAPRRRTVWINSYTRLPVATLPRPALRHRGCQRRGSCPARAPRRAGPA